MANNTASWRSAAAPIRENTLHSPYPRSRHSPRNKRRLAAIGIAVAACGVVWAQTTRSVWDGVYTEEQAKRGQAAYTQECSMCHGAELAGGDEVPPLSGNEFLSNWNTL